MRCAPARWGGTGRDPPRVSVVLVFVCLRYERGSPAPVFAAFDSCSHRRALRIGAWSTCTPGKVRRSNPLPATLGTASRPNGISDWVTLPLHCPVPLVLGPVLVVQDKCLRAPCWTARYSAQGGQYRVGPCPCTVLYGQYRGGHDKGRTRVLDLLIWFFRVELADQQGPISKSQIPQSPNQTGLVKKGAVC
jgi:hypothetical protein